MVNEDTGANWAYKPEGQTEPAPPSETKASSQTPEASITWTASEYVASHKSFAWYVWYFVFLIVCVGGIYFVTKDLISVIAIGTIGLIFSFIANKKPRQLAYEISSSGVFIGSKFYSFNEFKSFSLSSEGVIGAINLLPLKRFMPEISIYFPPEQADEIMDILLGQLPHEQRQEDGMDRLAKRFRF